LQGLWERYRQVWWQECWEALQPPRTHCSQRNSPHQRLHCCWGIGCPSQHCRTEIHPLAWGLLGSIKCHSLPQTLGRPSK
jgi:hypothetical protein